MPAPSCSIWTSVTFLLVPESARPAVARRGLRNEERPPRVAADDDEEDELELELELLELEDLLDELLSLESLEEDDDEPFLEFEVLPLLFEAISPILQPKSAAVVSSEPKFGSCPVSRRQEV